MPTPAAPVRAVPAARSPRGIVLVLSFGLSLVLCGAGGDRGRALDFLVIGDWGRDGRDRQSEVASQMAALAEREPAAFVISTGDNFYESGVERVDSPQWRTSFEDVYRAPALQIPWFVVLGNHDHRGNVMAQVAYGRTHRRWRMPARWFEHHAALPGGGSADFFFLDTQAFVAPDPRTVRMGAAGDSADAEQLAWLERRLTASRADWRIVVGHHPVISYGMHGDTPRLVRELKPVLERHRVQLYLNGHDHDMQHLEVNGVHYVTSGAGSSTRPTRSGPETRYSLGETAGFLAAHLAREQLRACFVDWTGRTTYEFTVPRRAHTGSASPRN